MNWTNDNGAGRLSETAWLITLAVTPLLFNPFSHRGFEPEKAALVFTMSIVMFCALLWRGQSPTEICRTRIPKTILFAVCLLTLSQALSTLIAVSPLVALLGSYDRSQGFIMQLAWCLLWITLIGQARRPEQINRLNLVIVLASIPVCLYGLLQHFGFDCIPWADPMTVRCASTAGNPVFLGAYLCMLVPLTTGLALCTIQTPAHVILKSSVILLWTCTLTLQLLTLWATGSRGPLLGTIAGVSTFGLLILLRCGYRRLAAVLLTVGLLALSLIMTHQIHAAPPQTETNNNQRLTLSLLNPQSTTSRIRLITWQTTSKIICPHEPLKFTAGSYDRYNCLRPVIGYGPECLAWVFDPFYPPELGRLDNKSAIQDRAHNETWDTLVTSGLLGLTALLLLYSALFHYGFKQLGLIQHRKDNVTFLGCCLTGALTGVVLSTTLHSLALAGAGLPIGLIGGLFLYVVFAAPHPTKLPPLTRKSIIGIALLSGLIAHIVEVQFGFATILTQTLFWVFSAILLISGTQSDTPPLPAPTAPPGQRKTRFILIPILGIATILLLCGRPLYANHQFTTGLRLQQTGHLDEALNWFQKATRLAPYEETYYSILGKSRFARATSTPSERDRDEQMAQAVFDLKTAQGLNPLRSQNAINLGGLYMEWARRTTRPTEAYTRGMQSDAYYKDALSICPGRVLIWNERALLHLDVLQSPDLSKHYLDIALTLDPDFPWTHELLGDYYGRQGYQTTNQQDRIRWLRQAQDHYEQVADLEKTGRPPSNPFELFLRMTVLARDMDDLYHARLYAQEALRRAPREALNSIQELIRTIEAKDTTR